MKRFFWVLLIIILIIISFINTSSGSTTFTNGCYVTINLEEQDLNIYKLNDYLQELGYENQIVNICATDYCNSSLKYKDSEDKINQFIKDYQSYLSDLNLLDESYEVSLKGFKVTSITINSCI